MRTRRTWITRAVLVVMLLLALTTSVFASNPTDEPGSKMIECPDCGTSTACMVCHGLDPQCESCGGTNVCATCGGTGYVQSPSSFYNTAFSLLPPVIAIALALNTKEVYTSLLVGIADRRHCSTPTGNLELALTTLFFNEDGGMVSKLSDCQQRGHPRSFW